MRHTHNQTNAQALRAIHSDSDTNTHSERETQIHRARHTHPEIETNSERHIHTERQQTQRDTKIIERHTHRY